MPVGRSDALAGLGVEPALVADLAEPAVAVAHVAHGLGQRAAHHVGRAAGGGARVERRAVGVGVGDFDLAGLTLQELRRHQLHRLPHVLAHLA